MLRHLFNILRVQWSENTCDDGYNLDRNIDTTKIIPLLDRVQQFFFSITQNPNAVYYFVRSFSPTIYCYTYYHAKFCNCINIQC